MASCCRRLARNVINAPGERTVMLLNSGKRTGRTVTVTVTVTSILLQYDSSGPTVGCRSGICLFIGAAH